MNQYYKTRASKLIQVFTVYYKNNAGEIQIESQSKYQPKTCRDVLL